MTIQAFKGQSLSNLTVYLIFAAFAVVVLLLFLDYGKLQLTYDSHDYIRASESAEVYLRGKNEHGYPYMNRAPLLYAYLHFFDNKILAAWWLNTVSFLVSLALSFAIGHALQLKRLMLCGVMVTIVFCFPWLQNHFFLWTEPLFSALILLLVYGLVKRWPVFVIVLICLLCFFLRKAGIVLLFGTCFYYISIANYRSGLIVGVIGVATALGWYGIERYFSEQSSSAVNVAYLVALPRIHYGDVLSSWIFPRAIPLTLRLLLNGILFLLAGSLLRANVSTLLKNHLLRVLIVIFGSYLAFFLLLFGTPEYMEAERFISVLIPLFILILYKFIQEVLANSSRLVQRTVVVLLLFWTLYSITRTLSHLL